MLEYAKQYGLLADSRIAKIEAKKRAVEGAVKWMESNRRGEQTWATLVRRNEAELELPENISGLSGPVLTEALYRVRYDGYLKREMKQVEKLNNLESILVPRDFDFLTVKGLKKECALKLNQLKPSNLGQAGRVSGVNPVDISILIVVFGNR